PGASPLPAGLRVGLCVSGDRARSACDELADARPAGGIARSRDVVPSPVSPRGLAALRGRQPVGVGRARAGARTVLRPQRAPRGEYRTGGSDPAAPHDERAVIGAPPLA